jgi:hypothetical protein
VDRLVTALRFLIVGPEFLVLLVGGVLAFIYPEVVRDAVRGTTLSEDVLRYVAVVPLASSAWFINNGRNLLFPGSDKEKLLQRWPDYWRLKYGFNAALFYSAVLSITAVVSWATWSKYEPYSQMAMAIALVGTGANFLTCYYAQISIEEALAKLDQSHS